MKNQTNCSTNTFIFSHPSWNTGSSFELVFNELYSIPSQHDLNEQFSEYGFKSAAEFAEARRHQSPSSLQVVKEGGEIDGKLPQELADYVNRSVTNTRTILEQGQDLLLNAFIGNTETNTVRHISFDPYDEDDVDEASHAVRVICEMEEANFVLLISEAVALRADKRSKYAEICKKYGHIAKSPYAIRICGFLLETYEGLWVAQANIKPKGYSKKKRTIGNVEFVRGAKAAGSFTNFLPKMDSVVPLPNSQFSS